VHGWVTGSPTRACPDPAAIRAALLALGHYRRAWPDSHGASRFSPPPSSAVREAPNAAKFLQDGAQDRHGLEVDLVSGPEEARLNLSGVLSAWPSVIRPPDPRLRRRLQPN